MALSTSTQAMRVLFVDDDEAVRGAFARFVKWRGFSVDTARSATEALASVRQRDYAVVVSDWRMPGTDGVDFLLRIQEASPQSRCLILTGTSLDELPEYVRTERVCSVLPKPWNKDRLVSALRKGIDTYKLLHEGAVDTSARGKVLLVKEGASKNSNRVLEGFLNEQLDVDRVPEWQDNLRTNVTDYQAVLLDLALPEGEAVQRAREIQSLIPSTPVVVLARKDEPNPDSVRPILTPPTRKDVTQAVRYAIERKSIQDRLLHLARFDQLTGLANRESFMQHLEEVLENSSRLQQKTALFAVGLNRFKEVNDAMGHEVGDDLLRAVAARLREVSRGGDMIARLGGDEFVIVLENIRSYRQAHAATVRVLEAFRNRFEIDASKIRVAPSIGIAMAPDNANIARELMRCANSAMHHAKQDRGSQYRFFSASAYAKMRQRLRLESDLREAVERSAFELHYQPQICLHTGAVRGYEALIRWRHPTEGLVSPAKFIPILEEQGMIVQVGEWVIRQACSELHRLHQLGIDDVRIAVNLSSQQFESSGLVPTISRIFDEYDIGPGRLELEMTESTLAGNTEQVESELRSLRSLGVRVAIDDFGTGYSSLAYLRSFSIDALKIDRSFIRHVAARRHDTAIVEAIISLGRHLALEVVAEGVETPEQQEFLRNAGCDLAQGFYYGRPAPAAEAFSKELVVNE